MNLSENPDVLKPLFRNFSLLFGDKIIKKGPAWMRIGRKIGTRQAIYFQASEPELSFQDLGPLAPSASPSVSQQKIYRTSSYVPGTSQVMEIQKGARHVLSLPSGKLQSDLGSVESLDPHRPQGRKVLLSLGESITLLLITVSY